jgi:hypothetical protein
VRDEGSSPEGLAIDDFSPDTDEDDGSGNMTCPNFLLNDTGDRLEPLLDARPAALACLGRRVAA